MKYALVFSAISGGLIYLSISAPLLSIPLGWTALSFLIVAVGYGGLGVSVFGKTADGKIPLGRKIILLPFLLLLWSVWHLTRILSREASTNQITDNLTIGRRLTAKEIPAFWDCYIDLTSEFEDPVCVRSKSSYLSFPLLDAGIPSHRQLDDAIASIPSEKIFIHCAQGHGRTGLFAIALLHHQNKINSLEEGLTLLQNKRPALNLNKRQRRFMEEYFNRKKPNAPSTSPPKPSK